MAYLEYTYPVTGREADYFGCLKSSGLMVFLQEAAESASREYGFHREVLMEQYGLFWVVLRTWFRLDRPIRVGSVLTIRTYHRPVKGYSMYRDFDLFMDGQMVGEAVAEWALCEKESRSIARLNDLSELLSNGHGGELCKDRRLKRIAMPPEMEDAGARTLYYSDADLNRHVNNTRYADFACDVLDLSAAPGGSFVSEFEITFSRECRPGELLWMKQKAEGARHYVAGLGKDGKTHFQAVLSVVNFD